MTEKKFILELTEKEINALYVSLEVSNRVNPIDDFNVTKENKEDWSNLTIKLRQEYRK